MPTWLCNTVACGSGVTDEAAFAAVGLRSNGLAIIAYTEDDSYNITQRLRVGMQQILEYIPAVRK
jgi:hypothetical protein